MNKKALFVLNPHAGKGQIKNHLLTIIDTLVKAGYEVTVHPTQQRGEATEIVENRDKNYDLVVCSGGDGTLDEIVTGMIKSGIRTPIGYIPAGSTNDFAKSLKIPSTMKRAAEIVVSGKLFPCDAGLFNDDVFVYVAAFGIFTEVSYETPQEMKNMLGHGAYLLEAVKQIQSIKSYHMKITYMGIDKNQNINDPDTQLEEHIIEDDFIYGMVTNSLSIGGFKNIIENVNGKDIALNDGLFEVILVKCPKNPIELNMILASLVSDKFDTEYMYCFKAKDIKIESPYEVAWTLDGEFGGKHTQIEMKNAKEAIDIIVK